MKQVMGMILVLALVGATLAVLLSLPANAFLLSGPQGASGVACTPGKLDFSQPCNSALIL